MNRYQIRREMLQQKAEAEKKLKENAEKESGSDRKRDS
jgi:hypothetical protein